MSMADQYDDGRYDGEMNPGYIELPGGWCVPKDQAPEPFAYPAIERGGIKYPTRTHTMETNEQREAELRAINALREELSTRAADLRRKIRANKIPLAPTVAVGDSFAVDVKFTSSGPHYRFLLQRVPGKGWYTTGQKPENAQFPTWEALVTWLRGPDVHSHSSVVALNKGPVVLAGTDWSE
jgi:8-oxo-dGTP pyrophosphatase MutT (NUDIX family)